MAESDNYSVTSDSVLRDLLQEFVPKDRWIYITDIYNIVERNIGEFQPNDFDILAENNHQPKWKRNIRNALQKLKISEILWDGNGGYMFPGDVSEEVESSRYPQKSGLSEAKFFEILERQKEIGRLGEECIVYYERKMLTKAGRSDLALKVRRISIENVGAGFDVLSFDENDNEKYIEVKTTVGTGYSFEITQNELNNSKARSNYYVYFVRMFSGSKDDIEPIIINGKDLDDRFKLTPRSCTATVPLEMR